MAEHPRDVEEPALLVGAGRRARELGAVLAALAAIDPAGARREAPKEHWLADLEELSVRRSGAGLLILEPVSVPPEDIGFVRRFLERHPSWSLLVVGEDEREARASALVALARARWLAWPPDLERLRALLPLGASRGPGGERAPRAAPRRAARGGPENGGVELGLVLEELLAGAALLAEGTARFQFSASRKRHVACERETLCEGLKGLVELARACAGTDGLVRATLGGDADPFQAQIEFPLAGLPETDLPGLLGGRTPLAEPGLSASLKAARQGAELLRTVGGLVELASAPPGRVRCEVRFSTAPARAEKARAGKPDDPFA